MGLFEEKRSYLCWAIYSYVFSEHGRLKRINERQENGQGLILLLERTLKNYFGNQNTADAQGSAQQQH